MRVGISGGSGDLSRRIINELIESGFPTSQLVVGTRSPERLKSLREQGVDVRRTDFSDAASVRAAFGECDRVLLVSIEDPLFDVKGREFHANAIKACAESGVQDLMYTSCVGAFFFGDGSPYDVHADAERHLQASGCRYTILRYDLFADMIEFDLRNAVRLDGGTWLSTAGDGACAWICKADIARSTAAILRLTEPSTLYTLTGDQCLSLTDVVRAVNQRFGTKITHKSVTPNEFDRYYEDRNRDEVEKNHLRTLFSKIAEGHMSIVTNDVERLTGMKPAPFLDAVDMT